MATNTAAIAMAMMNGEGGGSGGDVTKQYVDEHLALKADKSETAEYPIASNTTGINPTITDSADGFVQGLTVYGRTDTVEGELHGIGDSGEIDVVTCGKNLIPSWASGYINTTDGKTVEPNLYWTYTPNYIALDNDRDYVISADITNRAALFYYDATKNFISVSTGIMTSSKQYVIRNVPTQFKYIRLGFNVSGASVPITAESMPTYKVQIELGSTATAYEPYISTTATVTTGIPLYSVGDVKDELDEKRGMVVKRCEKINLSTLSWTLTANSRWATTLTDAKPVNTNDEIINAISNNYTATSANELFRNSQLIGMALNTNNDLLIRNGSDTDTPTGDIVYELAEPYEIPLTASELSALRNLRTYNPTTNITITDDPTVDIGYLLNTDNGQAVADVQNELQGQISNIPAWITDVPEMHRNIFRGRSLGSTVTAAQLAAIEDGSFDDLYVGDYWTIPTTVDGTTKDVKYRIIDVDYFLNRGNSTTKVTAHHLVVMPDDIIATAPYNTTAAQVFFKTSSLYTTTLPAINTTLTDIFGNNLLEHTIPVEASGSLFGRQWATLKADIPSMSQVIGSTIYINNIAKDTGNTQPLFALFALCPRFFTSESAGIWWLRDLYAAEGSLMQAQVMGDGGMLAYMNFTTPEGVRPYFLLGDAGT